MTNIHESIAAQRHLLTVAEYMTLGISERTELLDGVIYDVAPKNEPHILAVARLVKALNRGLDDKYIVRAQDPIAVAGWTGKLDPQIDVVVALDKAYAQRAVAGDAFAFIEVSDTPYVSDRQVENTHVRRSANSDLAREHSRAPGRVLRGWGQPGQADADL